MSDPIGAGTTSSQTFWAAFARLAAAQEHERTVVEAELDSADAAGTIRAARTAKSIGVLVPPAVHPRRTFGPRYRARERLAAERDRQCERAMSDLASGRFPESSHRAIVSEPASSARGRSQ